MSIPQYEIDILDASRTAFVDSRHSSSLIHRPQFISNDYARGKKVLSSIEQELSRCSAFTFSVAFITQSGITPLLQVLKELENKGIPGRILTTDYLTFSEPKALMQLNQLQNIEIRMYETATKSHGFHTKGYIFEYTDGTHKALIGSSNITASALTTNKEWNVQFTSAFHGELLENLTAEFSDLWQVSKPLFEIIDVYRQIYDEKIEILRNQPIVSMEQIKLDPNVMQTNFVKNLDNFIEEGKDRALLISATGTGKTFASAFAIRHNKPEKVLFLAHREQVLKQSIRSYSRVLGDSKKLGLLSGNSRDTDCDYLFATMQMMSKDEVLHHFDPSEFSFIVIDEVHRAGSMSYRKILNYFKADFYLGMTASPDRPDGFDIYGLFNNNIAYEIRLKDALKEDLLCAFHYFGITDLSYEGRVIDDEHFRDFSDLTSDGRVSHILEQANYYGFSGDRVKGLIFCSTKQEGRELSNKFNKLGYNTIFLSGDDSQQNREDAISRLATNSSIRDDQLDYIFTVDIFNEGVDVPEINQVIMLRPTESPIVFVQQLGRGLRKSPNKEFVVVLDFIGNYKTNFMIPLALSGDRSYNKDTIRKYIMEGARVIPGASSIHFDEVSRNLIFESIDRSNITLRLLKDKYLILKNKLGKIPSMVDFFNFGEIDPLLFINKKFSYHDFLLAADSDYTISFSEQQVQTIRFLSQYLASGMRVHELVLLRDLIKDPELPKDDLVAEFTETYSVSLDEDSYHSALRVLNKDFLGSAAEISKYSQVELIDFDDESICRTKTLTSMLQNTDFKTAVLDIIDFGFLRNRDKYQSSSNGLVLYEKYSRKDVCRLLNWDQDDSSTVYGYAIKHGTCPIFVTYHKQDDIASSTKYEDRFIDQKTFSWMTRSNRTLESKEVQKIINANDEGTAVHLFIKKHDSEGSDFYYIGKADPTNPTQEVIENDRGEELSIVNFKLNLEHAVRDDVYDYLTHA